MELLRENDTIDIDETDDMSGLALNFSLLEESKDKEEDISDILVEPRSEITDDNVIAMLRRGGPRPSRIENQLRDDLAGVIYKIIMLFPGTKKRENSSVFALKLTDALMNRFRELAQSGTVKEREKGLTKFKQNASRKFKRSSTDMQKSDRASFDMLMGQFNRLIQAIRQERKRVIRRRYTAADMAIPTRRRAGQGRKTPPRKKRVPQKKASKSTISRMNTRLANIRKKRKAAGISGRKEERLQRQMQEEKMRSNATRRSPAKKKKKKQAKLSSSLSKAEKDRIRREEKALKERVAKRRKAARQKEQQRAAFQRVMREIRSPRKKGRLSRREQLLAMTPNNPSAMLDSLASLDLAVALQQPGIALDAPSRRLLAHSLRILRYTPQWQWRKESALTEPVRQAIARVLSIRANRERLDKERREYDLASRIALQGFDDDDDAPDYSPDSGYVPGSPDYGVISSPVYDPGSPAYNPGSPAYMPYSPGYAAESRPAEELDDMVELDLGPPVVQTKRLSEMDMIELKDLAKEVSSEKEVDSLLKKNKGRSDRRKALMNLIIKKRLRRTSGKRSSKKQTKIDAERSIAEIKMKLRQEGVGFDEKGRAVISPLVSSGFAKSLLDELEVLEKIAYGKSRVKAKRPARKPKSPARTKRVLYSMKWGCAKNENKSNPRIPKLWMIVGYEEEDFGSGDVRRYVKLKDSSGKGRVKQMKVSEFDEKYQRKEEYEAEMEKLSSELLDQFLADGGNRKDFSLVDALCPKRRKKKKKSAKPSSPGRAAGASGFRVGDIVMKVKGARNGEQVRITSVDANGKVGGVFVSDGKTCRKSSSANFSK